MSVWCWGCVAPDHSTSARRHPLQRLVPCMLWVQQQALPRVFVIIVHCISMQQQLEGHSLLLTCTPAPVSACASCLFCLVHKACCCVVVCVCPVCLPPCLSPCLSAAGQQSVVTAAGACAFVCLHLGVAWGAGLLALRRVWWVGHSVIVMFQ